MVSSGETRNYARYDLKQVKAAAANGSIVYTAKVEEYMAALSYSIEDLCACLTSLSPGEFDKSHWYDNYGDWFDAYVLKVRSPQGSIDELYIKFRLTRNRVAVSVVSFHPTR